VKEGARHTSLFSERFTALTPEYEKMQDAAALMEELERTVL
jgi:hypothetical protein